MNPEQINNQVQENLKSENNITAISLVGVVFLVVVGYFAITGIIENKEGNKALLTPSPVATITTSAEPIATTQATDSAKTRMDDKTTQTDKLVIEDQVVGTGAEAVAGKNITVNYTGTLTNGIKFDSSFDHGQPFSFTLGAGQVIAGWDQGFAGMKIGGKRKLTIPPSLGYGSAGAAGVIPPNATLIFVVELLKVE